VSPRSAVAAVSLVAAMAILGACTAVPGAPDAGPSGPQTAPTSAPATQEATSPSPTDASSSAGGADTTEPTEGGSDEGSGESTPPPVLGKDASGRDLTTADFFQLPEGWRDGRFDVAGKQQLSGIAGPLINCEDDATESTTTLELRLANNFGAISMNLGQSDDSRNSDAVLYVKVLGNGKYLDATSVPFNKIQPFSVKVPNVNALKIQVWMGGEKCDDGEPIDAVVMNLRVE
jgi:hypothetical protein